MLRASLIAVAAVVGSGCGYGIVPGPQSQVLEQVRDIHTRAGHRCETQGRIVLCDMDDSSRPPLLVTAPDEGPPHLAFMTFIDTRERLGGTCEDLASALESVPPPAETRAECEKTRQEVDRLVLFGLVPLPRVGITDTDFEAITAAFLSDAGGFYEQLRAAR